MFSKKLLFDFDVFYNKQNRVYCHIAFWVTLMGVYMIDMFLINDDFPFSLTFVIVFRQIVQSVFFYYLTAYITIPRLLFRKKFILAAFFILIPFITAPTLDFTIFHIFNGLLLQGKVSQFDISLGVFVTDIHNVFNRQDIILSIMPILLRTLPAFLMKLSVAIIRFFSNADRQKAKQHKLEMENLQLEVNFLKSQMNPHYLFNTLNNIYTYAYLKDDRALQLISDLSEVLSYTLYKSKDTFVPLDRELMFIEHYLNLEKPRLKKNGAVMEMEIDKQYAERLLIAPLLLFPFVENAIKHGIEDDRKAGWMKLAVSISGDTLTFNIRNSKKKDHLLPDRNDNKLVGGIGIAATRKRLRLMYPSAHEISIEDNPNAYVVHLNIKCLINERKPELHHS